MSHFLFELSLFSAKTFILVISILFLLAGIFIITARAKGKTKGRILITNLNDARDEIKQELLTELLSKKKLKQFLKNAKSEKSSQEKMERSKVFFIEFSGDIQASAAKGLTRMINAIVSIANPSDEVVISIESGGGLVNSYGLCAAQLLRLRDKNIPLTVTIDKIAASGGYLMACVANKILAAPYAIIGSIGVIAQMPNFNRWLKEHHIDFEQQTAGEFKRTLTVFGENSEAARAKLREELETIHILFKQLIHDHRPQIDLQKVATGEHWLAAQAFSLQLVDSIKTTDAYLAERMDLAEVYQLRYESKKSFREKMSSQASVFISWIQNKLMELKIFKS